MRMPLDEIRLRAADIDSTLSWKSSPIGGSFGHVRSSGHKPHQGWDLIAKPGTPAYAICDGLVEYSHQETSGDSGMCLVVRLTDPKVIQKRPSGLWAFYAHLSRILVHRKEKISEGQILAFTGITGNARGTEPHLHFEIRLVPMLGKGLTGRVDPGEVLGYEAYSCRA